MRSGRGARADRSRRGTGRAPARRRDAGAGHQADPRTAAAAGDGDLDASGGGRERGQGAGAAQLALSARGAVEARFQYRRMIDDPFVLVAPAGSDIAGRASVTVDEVTALPLYSAASTRQQLPCSLRSRRRGAATSNWPSTDCAPPTPAHCPIDRPAACTSPTLVPPEVKQPGWRCSCSGDVGCLGDGSLELVPMVETSLAGAATEVVPFGEVEIGRDRPGE